MAPLKRNLKVVYSEDEEEEQENVDEPPRGRRKTKPSEKQSQLDAADLEAQQKKLDAMQRDLKKRQREMAQARKTQATATQAGGHNDELESEEESGTRPFSSSIQPLNVTYETPSQPRGELRCALHPFDELEFEEPNDEAQDDPWSVPTSPSVPPAVVASTTLPLQPTTSPNIDAKLPAFQASAVVNPKKPKAGDYEDIVQALIIRAASEYEALVCTKNAFPDTTTRHKWASKAWKNANRDAGEKYGITDAIGSLICQRGSRIRGHALTLSRPYLVSMLGFKKGSDASTVIANQQLAQNLKPADGPRFPFKVPNNRSGYGKAKIISAIIDVVWFDNASSQGIIFEKYFSPIPLETMALILTIIDFGIDEWSTGRFVKAKMWESHVVERHKVFRMDLEEWSQINQVAITGIHKKLYLRSSRNAGAVDNSAAKQTLVGDVLARAKQELDGRMGETDSEAEN